MIGGNRWKSIRREQTIVETRAMTRRKLTHQRRKDHPNDRDGTHPRSTSDVTALLTPNDIAARLQISAEQVRSLIRSGRLRAVNVGSGKKRPLYRVSEKALDEFIKAGSQTTTPRNNKTVRRLAHGPDFFPDIR